MTRPTLPPDSETVAKEGGYLSCELRDSRSSLRSRYAAVISHCCRYVALINPTSVLPYCRAGSTDIAGKQHRPSSPSYPCTRCNSTLNSEHRCSSTYPPGSEPCPPNPPTTHHDPMKESDLAHYGLESSGYRCGSVIETHLRHIPAGCLQARHGAR